MRHHRFLFLFLVSAGALGIAQAQDPPDPRAILEQSAAAMGGEAPADSRATGRVRITLGSLIESGDITISTRGFYQSKEEISLPGGVQKTTYSRPWASDNRSGTALLISAIPGLSAASPNFPLIVIQGALQNSDWRCEYVGPENLDGALTHHVRLWDTFSSLSDLADLSQFSVRDLWIDTASSLPIKLRYEYATAGGSAPRIPVELLYGDYRDVAGLRYPFRIEKTYNGTHWQLVETEEVRIDNGFTEADFSLE